MLYVYRRPRKSFKPRPFAVFPALLRRFSTASKGGGCGTTVLAASLASSLDRVEVAPVLLVADGGCMTMKTLKELVVMRVVVVGSP